VREDDALGIARGAGGEDQLQRAVRVGGGNGQIERGQGRGGFPVDHIAPGRQGAIPLVRGEGQHPAQAGQACAQRLQVGQRVVGGKGGAALAAGKQKMQLVPPGARIDGHDGSADDAGGHHGFDEFHVVGHEQRDAFARGDALIEHHLRQTPAVVPQLAVAAHLVGALACALDGQHGKVG